MGSLNSENSCTKLNPTSPNDSSSVSESKKITQSSELEHNSLTPPSLNFPGVKFELDGDVEVQSPDGSMWETFFSDNFDTDFMISSPVRNLPSPQTSSYNYNHVHAMQGQSLSGCSPPRYLSQLGAFSSSHKGKGQSPLHRVFNSPNNQYMQIESLSLPAIEEFLDDFQRDEFGGYQPSKMSGTGSSTQMFDFPTTVPAMLDCLTMPNPSRFCGSVSEPSSGGSQLSQERDIYQMGSIVNAPLSQQLQQEPHHETQQEQQPPPPPPASTPPLQHQQQNLNHSLMVPIPVGSEQVKLCLAVILLVSFNN